MSGPQRITASQEYQAHHQLTATMMENATNLVWATGGGMVPASEMQGYLARGSS